MTWKLCRRTGFALACALTIGFLTGPVSAKEQQLRIEEHTDGDYDPGVRGATPLSLVLVPTDDLDKDHCGRHPIIIRPELGIDFVFASPMGQIRADIRNSASIAIVRRGEVQLASQVSQRLCEGERVVLDLFDIAPNQYDAVGMLRLPLVVEQGGQRLAYGDVFVTALPRVVLANGRTTLRKRLSFGEARSGARETTAFGFVSNTAVSVSAISDGNGMLRHDKHPHLGGLPYTLYVGGDVLATNGQTELHIPRRPGTSSRLVEVEFVLGELEERNWAGRYFDVVTISLAAL